MVNKGLSVSRQTSQTSQTTNKSVKPIPASYKRPTTAIGNRPMSRQVASTTSTM